VLGTWFSFTGAHRRGGRDVAAPATRARPGDLGDALERVAVLAAAWVRRPLGDEDRGVFYSCVMLLLGERDIEVPSSTDPLEASQLIDALGIHLLT
jgi:hypothetical protein